MTDLRAAIDRANFYLGHDPGLDLYPDTTHALRLVINAATKYDALQAAEAETAPAPPAASFDREDMIVILESILEDAINGVAERVPRVAVVSGLSRLLGRLEGMQP
jgi:hypothetical protein